MSEELPAVARLYYSGNGPRRYKRASTQRGPGEPLCFVSVADYALRRRDAEIAMLRAELAASREREARMQWQPIETAPTDGARILLCGKGGKIADGYYGQPDGFANPKQFVWPYIHANPTHWMPLQAPPNAPAETRQTAQKGNQ